MTRRFEVGPVLVVLGAIVLLVSLFLDWYGLLSAWAAFELVDVALAALAVAAIVAAVGLLAADAAYLDRRWLPAIVVAVVAIVCVEIIDPPPVAAGETREIGAWLAFGAALLLLLGAVLSMSRVSFAISLEGRETRERVAVVDHRQDTTETAAVVSPPPGEQRAAE